MDLGDVTLVLGDNHSVSVTASASDFSGRMKNSIYRSQCSNFPFSDSLDGIVYVFSLTDRTVRQTGCFLSTFATSSLDFFRV